MRSLLEVSGSTAIGLEINAILDANHLHAKVIPIDMDDEIVIWIVPSVHPWPNEVLEPDRISSSRTEIVAEIGFSTIGIVRRTAAATHNLIKPMRSARVAIPFHPVLEEVLVPCEHEIDVMLPKERHISSAQRRRLRFNG